MRVVERLARRESTWRELAELLRKLETRGLARTSNRPDAPVKPSNRPGAPEVVRLGELHRAACADLMLAEAHDLPRETVDFLHNLVGRSHNAVYRAAGFRFGDWATELFGAVPRRLRADPLLRLAMALFWVPFFLCAFLAAGRPGFAEDLVGAGMLEQVEQMYSKPLTEAAGRSDEAMAGFYIQHNAGIGLQAYGSGLSFGLGTLWVLVSNALTLGVLFGHMATTPYWGNFSEFVTAHGPFELTAIVFSGAAGFRLGAGAIAAVGQRSLAPLRREARASLPTIGAAVFLFVLAAFLEGFVSASPLPYGSKAGLAIVSALALLAYLFLGGRSPMAAGAAP